MNCEDVHREYPNAPECCRVCHEDDEYIAEYDICCFVWDFLRNLESERMK